MLPERNLDVLRAAAVLAVLGSHLLLSQHTDASWLGRAGVLAFFVHTSLVLMSSIERAGVCARWMSTFFIRRAFRIYPLAIAAILLTLVARVPWPVAEAGVVKPFTTPSAFALVSNLLLIQNLTAQADVITVLWTLPLEVQMYMALPLCYLIARRSIPLLLGVMALGAAAGLLWQAEVVRGLWRLSVLPYVTCFLAGVLVYAVAVRRRESRALPSWLWPLWLTALAFGFRMLFGAGREPALWLQWAFCIGVALGILAMRDLRASWVTRAAKQVATYSYGCYLLHNMAIWFAFVVLRHQPIALQWAACVAAIVLLSWSGYHAVELPGIRLGQRVVRARAARQFVAPPAVRHTALSVESHAELVRINEHTSPIAPPSAPAATRRRAVRIASGLSDANAPGATSTPELGTSR